MSDETPATTGRSAALVARLAGFLDRHRLAVDVVVALTATAWALFLALAADSMYALSEVVGPQRVLVMQLTSTVLALAGGAALLLRRTRPVAVAGVLAGLGVVSLAVAGGTHGLELGLAVALSVVAATGRTRALWVTTATTVAALLVGAALLPAARTVGATVAAGVPVLWRFDAGDDGGALAPLTSPAWWVTAVPVVLSALAAVGVGVAVRARRLRISALAEAEAARASERAQRERLAHASERARIAREMHDVVAHSISVMVALGGGASAALDWAPDRARAALDELVDTGRAALGDMRRILGVLHDDASADEAAPRQPQPGELDVVRLVERARAAGLPVRAAGLAESGLDTLDPARRLAVFRIVQESVTNTLRHAPGSTDVSVDVRREGDAVEVVVTSTGAAAAHAPGPHAGRGLAGMTERAHALGGTFEAGPYGEGWRVRALLPDPEGDA